MKQNVENATESVERLLCNRTEARRMLGGISETTMWRWEQLGLIRPLPHLRHKMYSVEMLKRFANGGRPA